jgi:hypothetical protein
MRLYRAKQQGRAVVVDEQRHEFAQHVHDEFSGAAVPVCLECRKAKTAGYRAVRSERFVCIDCIEWYDGKPCPCVIRQKFSGMFWNRRLVKWEKNPNKATVFANTREAMDSADETAIPNSALIIVVLEDPG